MTAIVVERTRKSEAERLMDAVLQRFIVQGSWPPIREIEIGWRNESNPKLLAAGVGHEYIVWEQRGEQSLCYLTLRGIASRPGTADIANHFLGGLRYLALRYIKSNGRDEVSTEEWVTNLGWTEADARKTAQLVIRETGLASGWTLAEPPGWVTLRPNSLMVHLEDVRSLNEYWSVRARVEREEWDAAALLQSDLRAASWLLAKAQPHDVIVRDSLSHLESRTVIRAWERALERRFHDPEGAITAARTVLEAVCKHVLERLGEPLEGNPKLPRLYRRASELLELSPRSSADKQYRRILGACQTIVEGIGSVRNIEGDAHAADPGDTPPDARHATLVVNIAGAVAAFLVETLEDRG